MNCFTGWSGHHYFGCQLYYVRKKENVTVTVTQLSPVVYRRGLSLRCCSDRWSTLMEVVWEGLAGLTVTSDQPRSSLWKGSTFVEVQWQRMKVTSDIVVRASQPSGWGVFDYWSPWRDSVLGIRWLLDASSCLPGETEEDVGSVCSHNPGLVLSLPNLFSGTWTFEIRVIVWIWGKQYKCWATQWNGYCSPAHPSSEIVFFVRGRIVISTRDI